MRFVKLLLIVIVGVYLLAAVLYAIPVASGALDDSMEVKFDRADPSIVADYRNGLSQQQRESYYHVSQGSEILPWILLTAVDVADPGSSKPFVENLSRFGLLPDPGRDDGLPVGLTVATNPFTFGMEFVGVNCAACHVGELRTTARPCASTARRTCSTCSSSTRRRSMRCSRRRATEASCGMRRSAWGGRIGSATGSRHRSSVLRPSSTMAPTFSCTATGSMRGSS